MNDIDWKARALKAEAERDKLTAQVRRLYRMVPIYDAAQTIKGTGGAVEIEGVRIEPCDEFGATDTTRARDKLTAELAQVKQCRDEYGHEIDVVNARWDKLTAKLDAVKRYVSRAPFPKADKLLAILADTDEGKPLDRGEWEQRVLDEGERQVALGYTPEHDREHGPDHLILEGLERAFKGDTVQVAAMLMALRRLLADTNEGNER